MRYTEKRKEGTDAKLGEREREIGRLPGTQTDLERRRTIRRHWVIIRQETEKKKTRKSKMQTCNERQQRRRGAT